MKRLLWVLLAVLLAGCSPSSKTNNPMGPNFDGVVDLPPVVYANFDSTIASLKTSPAVKLWMDRYSVYNGYGVGWGYSGPDSTTDNAKNLAYNFWLSNRDKGVGGICGNFAGFWIYTLRTHGYHTGGVVYYWQQNGAVIGHIQAWIVEEDGRVSVTNNDIFEYKRYANLRELKTAFDTRYNTATSYCFYVDDHCNEMSAEDLAETFR